VEGLILASPFFLDVTGHVPVQPLPNDQFAGYSWGGQCPFRGRNTVEGLASSVALTERLEQITGKTDLHRDCLAELDDDHEVWNHAANALANLCVTLILTTSVEKIVIGGGIMKRRGLMKKIRKFTVVLLNKYLDLPKDMSELIAKSSYGSDGGLTGAIIIAQLAYETEDGEETEAKESGMSPFLVGMAHGVIVGGAVALVGILLTRRTK
jgi:fructokinase